MRVLGTQLFGINCIEWKHMTSPDTYKVGSAHIHFYNRTFLLVFLSYQSTHRESVGYACTGCAYMKSRGRQLGKTAGIHAFMVRNGGTQVGDGNWKVRDGVFGWRKS